MRPLAVQIRIVIDVNKRLAAEMEFIFENGSTVIKTVDVNTPHIFHFEDIEKEVLNAPLSKTA